MNTELLYRRILVYVKILALADRGGTREAPHVPDSHLHARLPRGDPR